MPVVDGQSRDIIVTGLPCAGATLVSALIDGLPNAVCLNRPPMHSANFPRMPGAMPFSKWIAGDFLLTRTRLMRGDSVSDFRAADGTPIFDGLHDIRRTFDEHGMPQAVSFTRNDLQPGFMLGMKHTLPYTMILPRLLEFDHFTVIAVIRHPFDVLSAWQLLPDHALARGAMEQAERYWPAAQQISESGLPILDRMVQLYELQLERYHALREHIHIIKYEDLMEDPLLMNRLLQVPEPPAWVSRIVPGQRILMKENIERMRLSLQKYGVLSKQFYEL